MTEKTSKRKSVSLSEDTLPKKSKKDDKSLKKPVVKSNKNNKSTVAKKTQKNGKNSIIEHKKGAVGEKSINKSKKAIIDEKPKDMDWNTYKKQKKVLKEKRRASDQTNDVVVEANKICEKLRRKKSNENKEERQKLIEDLHKKILKQNVYQRFVLKHDASRVIQCLLKYANVELRREISKQIIPYTLQMMNSKYGRYCIKRMLKFGTPETRSEIICSFYGHAVQLTSSVISAPIFEFAYSFASPLQKCHLMQEYYGGMFKRSKDDRIKHLKDVYSNSPDMKSAVLGSTKANLMHVINKKLLDSALVHTVLYDFLIECSPEDRLELVPQLANHAVVLSNSKFGAKCVLYCFWKGTNKDRKVIIKGMKDYVEDLCKHEHGSVVMIGILDSGDDVVMLNNVILLKIMDSAYDIAQDDWGRKVILWLVAPGESVHFHPKFMKELQDGRLDSNCKKDEKTRRKEILDYVITKLIENIAEDTKKWLVTAPITVVTLAILKAGNDLVNVYENIVKVLKDDNWKIDDEIPVENSAIHMLLKKIILHENNSVKQSFADILLSNLDLDVVKKWIKTCRGCFLFVFVFENGSAVAKNRLIELLENVENELKMESNKGSKLLLKKLKDI